MPPTGLIARFAGDAAALWPEGERLGVAVSGGPDSIALLLLAAAARPGMVEAATVDHGLRAESASEAREVAVLCASMGVRHEVLAVALAPGNLQDSARRARYEALGHWMERRGLALLATAHHADDQAETLLMRLARGSGLAGLAGVRARGMVPGTQLQLVRPLLGWRRDELGQVAAAAGVVVAHDPSNVDPRFDRARMRRALAAADWLDPLALARSAAYLGEAEEALRWLADAEWREQVVLDPGAERIVYRPRAPRAVRLIVLGRALREFGGEPRGQAVSDLLDALERGEGGNLAGVLAGSDGIQWVLRREPPRS